MRKARVITEEVLHFMGKNCIDVLLLPESYVCRNNIPGFGFRAMTIHGANSDEIPWAAIVVGRKYISVVKLGHLSIAHCTCVQLTVVR